MGEYDLTLGTLLVGIFFNTFLFGVVTYQFAAYYHRKFNDQPVVKYMVLFLFILDTFYSVSAIYMAWYYTVTNYGNPAALEAGVWPYPFTAIGDALTAFVTQIYLGSRIWRLTSNKILYGLVILLAFPSLVLGVISGIWAWILHVLIVVTPLVIAWFSISVLEDIFITTTLVIIFTRSRTGFRRTDTILNRLIRGAIQTGLFASIFALGDLISFLALPNSNLYGTFAIPLGRIYTNTLMDTLLTRESISVQLAGTYDARATAGEGDWEQVNFSQATTIDQSTSTQIKSVGDNLGEVRSRAPLALRGCEMQSSSAGLE